MSDPDVLKTQGTTVTIGSTSLGRLTKVTTPSGQITEIDITCLASTEKEYLPGLLDRGEFTVTAQVGAAGPVPTSTDGEMVEWTIGGTGVSYSGMGYVKAAPANADVDGIWLQDITVRCSASGE